MISGPEECRPFNYWNREAWDRSRIRGGRVPQRTRGRWSIAPAVVWRRPAPLSPGQSQSGEGGRHAMELQRLQFPSGDTGLLPPAPQRLFRCLAAEGDIPGRKNLSVQPKNRSSTTDGHRRTRMPGTCRNQWITRRVRQTCRRKSVFIRVHPWFMTSSPDSNCSV